MTRNGWPTFGLISPMETSKVDNVFHDPYCEGQQVKFFHGRKQNIDKEQMNGGVTIAYAPADVPGGRMYRIAVAICSPKDRYTRAIGRELAYNRFIMGSNIVVPIYRYPGETVETAVQRVFSSLAWEFNEHRV